jgi:subtilisin-like proprotein convertase family protein
MISRRSFVTGSAGLIVPVTLGHPAVTAKRKRRRKKKKTVTRTFSNTQTIDIEASGTRSSQIAVSGLKKGKLLDVNVILNGFTHPQPDDVDLMLVAPDSKNALILSDGGGNDGVSGITLTLDDEAIEQLPNSDKILGQSYRPSNFGGGGNDMFLNPIGTPAPSPSGNVTLFTFDSINPNGTWTLFVADDTAGDSGLLASGWTLVITAQVQEKRRRRRKKR